MSDPSPWARQIPNALSALRLGLAVLFPLATAARPIIVVGAAFSDFADGWIARRFGFQTWIGGLLDAAADKTFVLCVLVTLTLEERMAAWQAALLLTRDVVVMGVAAYAAWRREWRAFRHMPARFLGKLTTATLFALFVWATLTEQSDAAFLAFGAVAGACSVAAGGDYLRVFLTQHRSRGAAAERDAAGGHET